MLTLLVVIILLACLLLIGIVLIQNPKGGGLSQSFGGFSNQVMGVQRTTDFLEKATWGLMGGIAVLSLLSIFFISKPTEAQGPAKEKSLFEKSNPTSAPTPQPQQRQQPQQQSAPPANNGNTANPLGNGSQPSK